MRDMTLAAAREALAKREISAVELVDHHISTIEKLDGDINAFITTTPDQARLAAKAADEQLAKGEGGLLCGIPLGVKDLFCTDGTRTTAGSNILRHFVPPYESTVTANLLKQDAVFLGKLNLDEFAMGSTNLTSAFGSVTNPWKRAGDDKKLVPGGSSGGSAAAVASGMVLGATGTDTGGSIRQPASFCGITGVKPTYGRCSRFGTIAFASSLDQAGPMARTLEDCALMLEAMAGFDPKDSTSVDLAVPRYVDALERGVKGLKVGIPEEYRSEDLPAEIQALWEQGIAWLRDAGAETVKVSLPHTKYGLPTYYIAALAEASSNLARYDGVRFGERVPADSLDMMYEATRHAGFGEEVRRRILMGTYVLSSGYYDAYYLRAQKIRTLIQRDFLSAFEKVDVLLTPTAPSAAFAHDEKPTDPVQVYLNDVFTVPASLAGVPALSLPAGLDSKGLPLGLQLIGRYFEEETLFAAGRVMEKAAGFTHRPALFAGSAA
ncbi:Asp-tRNA(Asn)/Glu-tRNA(Gln) amidotransferase subunit GatA [Brytella acorum]|uniref:Glutamyl-tRNA(Gln) amidotransferase subunit A n=1 Tax=Brytella acorum TaxID=2959299 RepID=A0AA35V6G5_9PROT|nr:Asp-tRNA(Asn)/Glu-tRNA(Gln) amidotransferase subunit GatA [Brytella acorum]MDF3624115.1 Asp-tRNA(Asn)/Glu-tRNA(Gln) amidotransferase subunit GatA [Brytella acorum]CAI9120622.1 Asp-tRNA(Asn)/Glu-tRNA(Gln) amidotransferase subunit GatA [Brytella acorum]